MHYTLESGKQTVTVTGRCEVCLEVLHFTLIDTKEERINRKYSACSKHNEEVAKLWAKYISGWIKFNGLSTNVGNIIDEQDYQDALITEQFKLS